MHAVAVLCEVGGGAEPAKAPVDGAAAALGDALGHALCALEELSLGNNAVGARGAEALAAGLERAKSTGCTGERLREGLPPAGNGGARGACRGRAGCVRSLVRAGADRTIAEKYVCAQSARALVARVPALAAA